MPTSEHSAQERSMGFLAEQSKRKRQALWLLLILVCVGIYWFSHWETERSPNIMSRSNYPSFVITNFKTDAYDAQGQLSYQLHAQTLTHFEETGLSHLTQPQFSVTGDEHHTGWHSTADKGLVLNNQEEIQLRDNVNLNTQSPEPYAYHIATPALDLYPNKQQASTQEPVTIIQAQHRIQSLGLEANWRAGELQLIQEVRAHYDSTP